MHRSSVCWSGASSAAKDSNMAVVFDHERSRLLKTDRIKIVRFENCTVSEQTDLVIGQMQSYFTQ